MATFFVASSGTFPINCSLLMSDNNLSKFFKTITVQCAACSNLHTRTLLHTFTFQNQKPKICLCKYWYETVAKEIKSWVMKHTYTFWNISVLSYLYSIIFPLFVTVIISINSMAVGRKAVNFFCVRAEKKSTFWRVHRQNQQTPSSLCQTNLSTGLSLFDGNWWCIGFVNFK